MFRKIACLFASAILCIAVGTPALAHAVELVTNGGFESFTADPIANGGLPGTFNNPVSWDTFIQGNPTFSGVNQGTFFNNPAVPHTGNNAFDFGQLPGSRSDLTQTITTVPGQLYNFQFWLANDTIDPTSPAIDTFTAVWSDSLSPNQVTVLNLSNDQGSPYTLYSFPEVAFSASTDIVFSGNNDTLWWHLDDVSVTVVNNPEAVPEPASILLLLTGGAGLLAFRKRIKP